MAEAGSQRLQVGRELLSLVKQTAKGEPTLCIRVGMPTVAALRPVAVRRETLQPKDVQVLTESRRRFSDAFLSQFEVSTDRTARWLINEVGPDPGRILFICEDLSGRSIGHLGLGAIDWARGYGEADFVVRIDEHLPGVMSESLQALMNWARNALGLDDLGVRVRSDNRALRFYERAGYEEVSRVPLVRVSEPGMTRWVEAQPSTKSNLSLVHMRWKGD